LQCDHADTPTKSSAVDETTGLVLMMTHDGAGRIAMKRVDLVNWDAAMDGLVIPF
jgi:hypothetical protein